MNTAVSILITLKMVYHLMNLKCSLPTVKVNANQIDQANPSHQVQGNSKMTFIRIGLFGYVRNGALSFTLIQDVAR